MKTHRQVEELKRGKLEKLNTLLDSVVDELKSPEMNHDVIKAKSTQIYDLRIEIGLIDQILNLK